MNGHDVSDCFKFNKKLEREENEKKASETALADFGEIESDDVLLATSPGRSRTPNWVLIRVAPIMCVLKGITLSITNW